MRLSHPRAALCVVLAAALASGCGGSDQSDTASTDSAATESDTASTATAASQPTAGTTASTNAPLTVADIDRWQKGMEAELEAVRNAGTQLRNAKTGTDSLNAITATTDMGTRSAGARAAGVDEERYQRIRTDLSSIVSRMAPLDQEMDVSKMPAAMVEELKKGREQELARLTSELPPELVEALRPRAAALRKLDLTLTGERLKAAGMAG